MAKNVITTTPSMPVDPLVSNWTRFVSTFEPAEYTGWIDESLSSKTDCFIGDLSPLLKTKVVGPDALEFLRYLTANSWVGTKPGQTKYAIMCQERGQIVGEGLVLVIDNNDFLISGVIHAAWLNFQLLHGSKKFDVYLDDQTEDWFIFQVQGPNSAMLIEDVSDETVRDLKYTDAKTITIAGRKVFCLRQGVTGEVGFEIWGQIKDSHCVFEAIVKAGPRHNLSRLGARCKVVNQTEAGFTVPTVDFVPGLIGEEEQLVRYRAFLDDSAPQMVQVLTMVGGSYSTDPGKLQCTPFDLGLGKLVKFDHEFIGREALELIARSPPRKLVTLIWNADDVADVFSSLMRKESYEFMDMPKAALGTVIASTVLVDGIVAGFTTSRTYSPYLKEMLSLCVIDQQYAQPGQRVTLIWGSSGRPQKVIQATVEKAPFKQDRRRVRLDINDS